MSTSEQFRFYVNCPAGFESVLAMEYHQNNLVRVKVKKSEDVHDKQSTGEDPGGMEFEGPLEHIFSANLNLRSASRVSVRIGEFIAITFAELRKKAAKLDWDQFLRPGQTVNIKTVCHKSRLYHSDAVSERVLGAINDHFSSSTKPCLPSNEGQLILVRLVNDQCTISVDSSGELLYKRGYRQAVAKAPLRENLAAAIILASDWDCQSPLIDPFCGSGTLPIEAALLARRIAPGINRSFQFFDWPIFNQDKWNALLVEARHTILQASPPIIGYDRDAGGIEMSKTNAARAGQKDVVRFNCQAVSYLEPVSPAGWLITNPPYGVRISENKDLRDLYARFGSILREKFGGWRLWMIASDDRLTANLGLGEPAKSIHFTNGGIPVKLVSFEID